MSDCLHFSISFARRMSFLAFLIGAAIAFIMPLTYFLMSWHKFHDEASILGQDIAWRLQETIRDNPALWYYSMPKFLDDTIKVIGIHKIQTVIIYDKDSKIKFKQVINKDISLVHPFCTPILYNNELYGFIEFYISTADIIKESLLMAVIFLVIGTATGAFLYWYPVHIIRLVEKDVQAYAKQAKQKAETEVLRLDRLKLVGQMSASIAHEVRNPLTTVRGYLQHFSRKDQFLPYSSQIKLMIEELDRANGIISEFLSLSHNKSLIMQRKNLNRVIEALQPLIQSDGIIRDIAVEYDLKATPDIIIDEKELRQLILNIVRNGFEAMAPGKCLRIATATQDERVVLSIIDEGKGIDQKLLGKIGTPFFTTKESGTGLGLAVCYSIAHRHGTTIDFTSGSTGTTCSISFPIPHLAN